MLKILAIIAAITVGGNSASENYIQMSGHLKQGGLVAFRATPKSTVKVDGIKLREFNGKYFVGFGRDAQPESIVEITYPDGNIEKYNLQIEPQKYDIQYINKVDDAKANPNPKNTKIIEKEAFAIGKTRVLAKHPCPDVLQFIRPADGIVSGVFGSQRVYNGVPGRPHSGVDFAQPEGAPAYAPEAGKIIYVEDMFLTGKTMVIDHGCGITSTFMHLSKANVKTGDVVERGQIIARIGSTGLATGPHLHWSLNLRQVRLDPLLVLE